MNKKVKFLLKSIIVIASIVIISFTALILWIKSGPKSLSFLKPYVEKELNSLSENYQVKIEDSFIKWDEELDTITISAKNVLLTNEEQDVIRTNELLFDFSFVRILDGKILSSEVTVVEPIFKINTDFANFKSKNIDNADEEKSSMHENVLTFIYKYLETKQNKMAFNKLRIKNAKLFIDNGEKESLWNIKEGFISVNHKKKAKQINSEFAIDFGKVRTAFNVDISNTKEQNFDIKIDFEKLPSYNLTDISNTLGKFVESSDLEIDGKLQFLLNAKGHVPVINYNITKVDGRINIPDYLPEEVLFDNLTSNGSILGGFKNLNIENMKVDFEKATFNVKGKANDFLGVNPEIKLDIDIDNLPLDNMRKYWPYQLSRNLRNWLTSRLKYGYLKKAKLNIDLTSEDLKKIASFNKKARNKEDVSLLDNPIDEKSINGTFEVTDATVNFHDSYPDIKNISTVITTNGNTLNAKIDNATLGESKISNINLEIKDLWNKPIKMLISGETSGRLEDYVLLLKGANAKRKTTPIIESIYGGKGFSEGKFSLEVPFKKKIHTNDLNLNVYMNSNHVFLNDFYKNFDVNQGEFALTIRKNFLEINGDALFNQADANFKYVTDLAKIKDFGHRFNLKASTTINSLKEIDVNIPFAKGDIDFDATFNITGGVTKISGNAKADKSYINIDKIAFEKDVNQPADIEFNLEVKDKNINIQNLYAKGDDFEFKGAVDVYNNKINKLNFSKAVFNNNNLAVQYTKDNNDIDLKVKANQFDYVNFDFDRLKGKNDSSKLGKFSFTGVIENILMKNDQNISNFMAKMHCEAGLCQSLKMQSTIANKNFISASINPKGDDYQFLLQSDNAGALIKSLGILNNINEGVLDVKASYPAKSDSKKFKAVGDVNLRKFKVVKTPVLGKLLTLASFRGITDLLNNKGISFNELKASFEFTKDKIKINNAKTSGSSVGLTGDGFVSLKDNFIDISGLLVPAYEINKVLGNIPVLGKIITGKENQGIIATKYNVVGSYPDGVKTSVNPLSVLTPGILRDIFNFSASKKTNLKSGKTDLVK